MNTGERVRSPKLANKSPTAPFGAPGANFQPEKTDSKFGQKNPAISCGRLVNVISVKPRAVANRTANVRTTRGSCRKPNFSWRFSYDQKRPEE
jgi:hypothetical protein